MSDVLWLCSVCGKPATAFIKVPFACDPEQKPALYKPVCKSHKKAGAQ